MKPLILFLLIILMLLPPKMITIWNYLGTTLVVPANSHISRMLMYEYGYILIGKKLPEPPWVKLNQ